MEEGEFNTEFFDKMNIKDIFGDVLGIKNKNIDDIDKYSIIWKEEPKINTVTI